MIVVSQFINKLLQSKDYSLISRNGLNEDYFKGFEKEFNFINDHYKRFGNIPDEETFAANFNDFKFYEVNETNDYLLDRLYEEMGYHKFSSILPELTSRLKVDSRDAYTYLNSQMENIRPHMLANGTDIISNSKERYDYYLNKQKNDAKVTIKSGLPELDEIFGGWEFGDELVTIVARVNAGKSWLLMKFLTEAWKQGFTVGLYSGEMNATKLGYRFDALYNHFSNRCLSLGAQTDGYDEYIEKLTKIPTPFKIITQKDLGGKATVSKLRSFVEQNEIDILGIDQFSLMADDRAGGRDPLRIQMAHISEDLFLMSSEYKIPILGLAQANRDSLNKNDDDAPGLENIKECDDIAANSSKVIGMRQASFGGMIIDITKNREGRVGDKLTYSWQIDVGHFAYIPSDNDAAKPAIRQQAQQAQAQTFIAAPNPF